MTQEKTDVDLLQDIILAPVSMNGRQRKLVTIAYVQVQSPELEDYKGKELNS
jgi:hypothetical protein